MANRRDKRPRLSDLRHFGIPKEAADKIILLYRDEMFNCDSAERDVAELTVFNKENYDKPGLMRLRTNPGNCRFEEVEEREILPFNIPRGLSDEEAMALWLSDDEEKEE